MACFNAVYVGLVGFVKTLIEKYFGPFDRLRDWMRYVASIPHSIQVPVLKEVT